MVEKKDWLSLTTNISNNVSITATFAAYDVHVFFLLSLVIIKIDEKIKLGIKIKQKEHLKIKRYKNSPFSLVNYRFLHTPWKHPTTGTWRYH